ncbi:MAG: vanadium-dependent haloperoxidase, partial [Verrucomicrobiales bacterium]|nr:vanadium-dependent haloperoxidase [Verrucomicrobiales bacterium]
AVSASTHDAACAAWGVKRYYESPRPVTMIRYMCSKGQSSDPFGPSYNVEGIPLEPGVCEVITAQSSAPGERHAGVGSVGQIAVFAWPGEPSDRATQTSPVRWIRGIDWLPYQRQTFNTPAFPGYISGHSTFSRAAAEVLAAITGSPFFPGGIDHFTAPANTYLVFERGPSQTVDLQWGTYFDAADQAGLSRRFGGIHPQEDDLPGRIIGSQCGQHVWTMAQKYWDGSILNDTVVPTVAYQGNGSAVVTAPARRGLFYRLQSSTNLIAWTNVTTDAQATDTTITFTDPSASGPAKFYRVYWDAVSP